MKRECRVIVCDVSYVNIKMKWYWKYIPLIRFLSLSVLLFYRLNVLCVFICVVWCRFLFIFSIDWSRLTDRPHAMYMIFDAIKRQYCPITPYICTDFSYIYYFRLLFILSILFVQRCALANLVRVSPQATAEPSGSVSLCVRVCVSVLAVGETNCNIFQ